MPTAFLDPNYSEEHFYTHLEPYLLIYERLYAYAPNCKSLDSVAKKCPEVSRGRFQKLVEKKLVRPVAGPWYWSREKRRDRVQALLKTDPARAALFEWDDDFDEKMQAHGIVHEAFYKTAEEFRRLPKEEPWKTEYLLRIVRQARKNQELPPEFYSASYVDVDDETVVATLLHHCGGDVAQTLDLKADATIAPPGMHAIDQIYRLAKFSLETTREPAVQSRMTCDPVRDLREEDMQILIDFCRRLCEKVPVEDIARDYWRCGYSRLLSAFVHDTAETWREKGYQNPEKLSSLVFDEFRRRAQSVKALKESGTGETRLSGAVAGWYIGERLKKVLPESPKDGKEVATCFFKSEQIGKVLAEPDRRNVLGLLVKGTAAAVGAAVSSSLRVAAAEIIARDEEWMLLFAGAV